MKGVGNQTGGGIKVQNLKIVENDWGKKYIKDALYAQTYLPHDRICLKLTGSKAKASTTKVIYSAFNWKHLNR